jgi:predicted small secreted protein
LAGADVVMEITMKLAYAAFAFLLAAAAAACNTVEGAGRDIESAGEGIQDAAEDVAE